MAFGAMLLSAGVIATISANEGERLGKAVAFVGDDVVMVDTMSALSAMVEQAAAVVAREHFSADEDERRHAAALGRTIGARTDATWQAYLRTGTDPGEETHLAEVIEASANASTIWPPRSVRSMQQGRTGMREHF
jgi:hypothetical protein